MLDLPPVLATENVVFVTGAFRRTLTVNSLENFVETGVPKGLLADLLRFTGSQPKPIQGLLKTEVPLPVTLTSRLLNTRIGGVFRPGGRNRKGRRLPRFCTRFQPAASS